MTRKPPTAPTTAPTFPTDERRIRDAFDKAGTPQRDRKAIVDGIDSDVRKKLVEPAVSEMVNEIAVTIRDVGPMTGEAVRAVIKRISADHASVETTD